MTMQHELVGYNVHMVSIICFTFKLTAAAIPLFCSSCAITELKRFIDYSWSFVDSCMYLSIFFSLVSLHRTLK